MYCSGPASAGWKPCRLMRWRRCWLCTHHVNSGSPWLRATRAAPMPRRRGDRWCRGRRRTRSSAWARPSDGEDDAMQHGGSLRGAGDDSTREAARAVRRRPERSEPKALPEAGGPCGRVRTASPGPWRSAVAATAMSRVGRRAPGGRGRHRGRAIAGSRGRRSAGRRAAVTARRWSPRPLAALASF